MSFDINVIGGRCTAAAICIIGMEIGASLIGWMGRHAVTGPSSLIGYLPATAAAVAPPLGITLLAALTIAVAADAMWQLYTHREINPCALFPSMVLASIVSPAVGPALYSCIRLINCVVIGYLAYRPMT